MRKCISKRRWKARGANGRLITGLEAMQYKLRGPWFDEYFNTDAAYMTNYNMRRFLYLRTHNTLADDLVWRGHDFTTALAARERTYALKALAALGLNYAGEHAMSHFAALYEVPASEAQRTLAEWFCWSQIGRGRPVKGAKTRAVEGPQGGQGATTLAG